MTATIGNIEVGIGATVAGTIEKLGNGDYLARVKNCRVIWDGYLGFTSDLDSTEIPQEWIHGSNDSDEAGYMVAVMHTETTYVISASHLDEIPSDGIILTAWQNGWEFQTYTEIDGIYTSRTIMQLPADERLYGIVGWTYPDRDQ